MRLFIAEKPSLAVAIASGLPGVHSKTRTYIEAGDDVVTWCVGHILEPYMPEDYDPSFRQWRAEALPIEPQQWRLKVKDGMQGQIKAISGLLKRADLVINAGDPDREGQLLVDEVLLYLGNSKPVQRVLVNDYNDIPLRKALATIKNNNAQQFRGWYDSALARSRFDWLFGLNLTRAYTLAARRIGYEGVLSVGRVQTPTLGLVVTRDIAIDNFQSVPFHALVANIRHPNGHFMANWRPHDGQSGLDADGRLIDTAVAQAIATRLSDKPARITKYEKKNGSEYPPLPFSLSSLQMAANDRHGFTAQQVLDTCQALYEKHKLTTYPRTDCNYLSEAQHADATELLAAVMTNMPELTVVTAKADTARKSSAFNDKKVTAHHAIVPTTRRMDMSNLNDIERKVYDMIVRTYLAQFFSPSQFMFTDIEVSIDGETFTANGKTPVAAGWREILSHAHQGGDADTGIDDKQTLPTMRQGDEGLCEKIDIKDRKTTPPKRFTDKLLLAAMLDIHKYVDDPAAKARLKEGQGIGTEATRAGIIEELKKRQFIVPLKAGSKELVSTPAARALIAALPTHAKNPALTGICEQALDIVAAGKLSVDEFIARNMQLIRKLVEDAASITLNLPVEPAARCPQCKNGTLRKRTGKNGMFWICSNWNAQPPCAAKYNDLRGKPDLNRKSKKIFVKKIPAKKAMQGKS